MLYIPLVTVTVATRQPSWQPFRKNDYHICICETRNVSWLYDLFWYPAAVTKGRYTLHIWYAVSLMISYWHNVDLIWSWHQTDIKPSCTGSLLDELRPGQRERRGIWFMANGEIIHCAVLIIRKCWIRWSWNSHTSHTAHKETSIYTIIFVRIDDVNACPLLVKLNGHRWFPLTTGQWCRGIDILIVVRVNRLLN